MPDKRINIAILTRDTLLFALCKSFKVGIEYNGSPATAFKLAKENIFLDFYPDELFHWIAFTSYLPTPESEDSKQIIHIAEPEDLLVSLRKVIKELEIVPLPSTINSNSSSKRNEETNE